MTATETSEVCNSSVTPEVLSVKRNIGDCSEQHNTEQARYCSCGYALSDEFLDEQYTEYCWSYLEWRCPVCSSVNKLLFKVEKKHSFKINNQYTSESDNYSKSKLSLYGENEKLSMNNKMITYDY